MLNVEKEEAIRLKIRNKIMFPLLADLRKRKLKYHDFTIISNNCWGGSVYESYGLRKMSPTVGMFFMPKDYLKFINNLGYYLEYPLSFIKPDESKYKNILGKYHTWNKYLIGKIDDVEVHMLHYHEQQIAINKWNERIKRINFERLIVKFNDNNGATKEDISSFLHTPIKNKLCFVSQEHLKVNNKVILITQPRRFEGDGIKASFEPFGESKRFNVTSYINGL